MALTVSVVPGYTFQANEVLTIAKLNSAANPQVNLSGSVSTLTLADGSVTTSKLADGVLSADAAGRPKMATGYIINTHFSAGALSADGTGRAVMASNFMLPAKITFNPGGTGTTGAVTLDWSTGFVFPIQATGNITFSFTNAKDGQQILIPVQQGAAAYTLTWPVGVHWGPSGAPTLTTTNGKVDFFVIAYIFGSYFGFYRQNF